MKLSLSGRLLLACVVSLAVALGMSACGGGTIGFLYVAGTQYNQVSGFKIDNYTGNLTSIVHSPFSSGGVNPVSLALRPGGRYLYVANKGVPATGTPGTAGYNAGNPGNIALYSVGGDGVLNFQQNYFSQGSNPIWIQIDSTGNFLFVLDQLGPLDNTSYSAAGDGEISVFAIAGDTGRLTLVTNQQVKYNNTNTQLSYFPVGMKPIMMKYTASALYVLNSDQSITAYTVNATSGQLTLSTNSTILTGGTNLNSINGNGAYIFLTDASTNQILQYTVSNGTLLPITGGPVANFATGYTPVQTMIDSKGKFLYVLNVNKTGTQNTAGVISAYTFQANGQLIKIADVTNPYPVGSGPVCMAEDPTNQFVYISNANDSTVTGFVINQNTGQLTGLTRGSTFPSTGTPTCLIVSGNVS